jgi:hypothetical protein
MRSVVRGTVRAAADKAEEAANQAAERFQYANDTSTTYVRNTLFTAMALFFESSPVASNTALSALACWCWLP